MTPRVGCAGCIPAFCQIAKVRLHRVEEGCWERDGEEGSGSLSPSGCGTDQETDINTNGTKPSGRVRGK